MLSSASMLLVLRLQKVVVFRLGCMIMFAGITIQYTHNDVFLEDVRVDRTTRDHNLYENVSQVKAYIFNIDYSSYLSWH